jgi:glycosyltransferase involved in cell wall biosynthesis
LKILVSAYACEPGRGSEPGIGWNWVCEISRFHETWVITRSNNRQSIEAFTANTPLPSARFVYFDLPPSLRFWKKGRRGMFLYYYLWQFGSYFVAKKLHKQIDFDASHHVTFGKYWSPSFLAALPIPFLWGPVGGGESEPISLWYSLSLRGKIYEIVRRSVRRICELDPLVRLTARRATLALATTAQTEQRLRAIGCRTVSILSHAALPEKEIQRLASVPDHKSGSFRVVSIGDLLHLKGYHLGLKAFAKLLERFPNAEYWLFGDGPERDRLTKLAAGLGIANHVTFWGVIPRLELLDRLSECDVLLHPVLHDSSGWASVEAMAAGRPVVCLDLGGTALQVTEKTGAKISAQSSSQVIEDLANALTYLAANPALCANMGRAARQRVAEYFNWSHKGQQLDDIYKCLTKAATIPV